MTPAEAILTAAADGGTHSLPGLLILATCSTGKSTDLQAAFWHLVDHGRLVRVPGPDCWHYALPDSQPHRDSLHACAIRHAPQIAREPKPKPKQQANDYGHSRVPPVFAAGHPLYDALTTAAAPTSIADLALIAKRSRQSIYNWIEKFRPPPGHRPPPRQGQRLRWRHALRLAADQGHRMTTYYCERCHRITATTDLHRLREPLDAWCRCPTKRRRKAKKAKS